MEKLTTFLENLTHLQFFAVLAVFFTLIIFLLYSIIKRAQKIIYKLETEYPHLDILPQHYFDSAKHWYNWYLNLGFLPWINVHLLFKYSKLPKEIKKIYLPILIISIIFFVLPLIAIIIIFST